MGAVPSIMHVKVKFPTKEGIMAVRGDQRTARKCLVAVINHEIKQKELSTPRGCSTTHRGDTRMPFHLSRP